MSDLSALLDALGPEPAPAPGSASFFTLLVSNALGQLTTDSERIRRHVAALLEEEGWALVDRTAECRSEDDGRTLLPPPRPKELTFLARTPVTKARLAALAKVFPSGHPVGIPYIPVTPSAVVLSASGNFHLKTLEGCPASWAEIVHREEAARPLEEPSSGEALRELSTLFAAKGWTLTDWTGRTHAGCVLPLVEKECAFVARAPGEEAGFERFLWSLNDGENDGSLQFLPYALVVSRASHLRLDWTCPSRGPALEARVEALVSYDGKRDPEKARLAVLGCLRPGWRLRDRTDECRPEGTSARHLAPADDNELVFLACTPATAPLVTAIFHQPQEMRPGITYVAAAPIALLLSRTRVARLMTEAEESCKRTTRYMMRDGASSSSSSSDSADSGSADSDPGDAVSRSSGGSDTEEPSSSVADDAGDTGIAGDTSDEGKPG
jgi:hypothetical protein